MRPSINKCESYLNKRQIRVAQESELSMTSLSAQSDHSSFLRLYIWFYYAYIEWYAILLMCSVSEKFSSINLIYIQMMNNKEFKLKFQVGKSL